MNEIENKQDTLRRIGKYTRHFFSGTLLSRVSGMLRDISMAAIFGDHPSVAAFMVAFRFSHFLRRILGEGALQSIFIPHYQEMRLKNEQTAQGFFFQLTLLLIVLLTTVILIVEVLGIFSFPNNEVTKLFTWMFPSLLFICLYGLNTSVLQCQNSFFLSSVAPLACNLVWIIATFATASLTVEKAMVYLAIFTGVGFAIQWLLTLSKTWKVLTEGRREFKTPLFKIPIEIKTIGKATLFGLIGVTAVQINSFLDMIFARYADLKGPVYLWYAIRLEQLPLALVGFACVYSIIPSLSKLIKSGSEKQAQDLFTFGFRRILLFVIPCTFALFALGFGSVNLLFGRGHFSEFAVVETTLCLWAYGLSLLPSTLTIYQSSLFYAYGDYKTPTIASLTSVAVNILFNALFVFVFHLGAISIALSTSLSSLINYWILKQAFQQKGYWRQMDLPKADSNPLKSSWKMGAASLIGLLSCLIFDKVFLGALFFEAMAPRSVTDQSLYFLGQLITFTTTFSLSLLLIYKELFFEIKALLLPSGKA